MFCFACLSPTLSGAGASQPYSPSFPIIPCLNLGVDSDPSLNLDLNLLSRTRASPLVKNWGQSPQESLGSEPVACDQGHPQGP